MNLIPPEALVDELDPDWIPPSVPDFDCLDNTREWGPFFISWGRPLLWDPPLWPAITREVAPPWRRGLGIQVRFPGLPQLSHQGIFLPSKAVTIGVWWKGAPPQDFDKIPGKISSVEKVAHWHRPV